MGIDWSGYSFAFTPKDNDDAYRLAEAVKKEGIDPRFFDGGGVIYNQENPPDGKITEIELFQGADNLLNDGIKDHRDRMLRAMKGAGLPAAGKLWTHKTEMRQSLADFHNAEATRLVQAPGPKDWDGIENHLVAVTHYESDDAGVFLNLGSFYLSRKDYPKALAAFHGAEQAVAKDRYKNRSRAGEIPLMIGAASFGTGDFKTSREAYTAHLADDPHDADVLRLRLETDGEYLKAVADPVERKAVETEMKSDRALALALTADEEKAKLDQVEKAMSGAHGLSTADKKDKMAAVAELAQYYLEQGNVSFAGSSDEEIVRSRTNALAAQAFGILNRFALADRDPNILRTSDLYRGYGLMAEGKMDEAVKVFQSIRTGFPEVDAMLRKMDDDALRAANLAGVDVWKTYVKEGSRILHDKADQRGNMVLEFVTGDFDGSDAHGAIYRGTSLESCLISQVESRLNTEKALTMKDALNQVAGDTTLPSDLRKRAAAILKHGMNGGASGEGDTLGPMVDYLSKLPPDKNLADRLLNEAFTMEAREDAAETPFAVYQLVSEISPEADIRKRGRDEMDALQKGGSFGRSFLKAVYATGTTGLLVDAAIMFASAGLGNLAKLRMLGYLEKAGVTGYRAVAVGRLTKYAVTATAMFVGNTGKAAMTQDADKVFSAEHLVKSYGATLIMVGLSEPLSELAGAYGTRAAKALGMVAEGGESLSAGGKLFVGLLNHTAGLSGMMAASYVAPRALNVLSGWVGWKQDEIRPWSETSAHDVYNYVLFAAAGSVTEKALGEGFVDSTGKVHSEIAVREARLTSRPLAERWVKATFGDKFSEMTADQQKALIDRRTDYLVSASFRPGFSGSVLIKHLEKGRFNEANRYLDGFGLSPIFSPHEVMGIQAPAPAAETSPGLWQRLFSKDFDIFGNRRSRWRFEAGAVRIVGGDGPPPVRDYAYAPPVSKGAKPTLVVDGREAQHLGDGANGDVFVHPWDPKYVIKYFRLPGDNKIGKEYDNLQELSDLGISQRPVGQGTVGKDGQGYLVMERVEGWTVEDLVTAQERGTLTQAQAGALRAAPDGLRRLIDRLVANGIDCADVNDRNVMIGRTKSDTNLRAYLVDGGWIRHSDDAAQLRDMYDNTFSDLLREPDDVTGVDRVAARRKVAADEAIQPVRPQEEAIFDRMKDILGVTDDTYLYRATRPQWIRNGEIGLNYDSVALVQDPYRDPGLLTDIERAYSDWGAAEQLFDSMWQAGTKASDLDQPGLNVSTDADAILSRYGGGPGSERVLIRIRLGDVLNARLYPDIGGGAGDKTIFYVTGEGPVPVEIYDPATQTWLRP